MERRDFFRFLGGLAAVCAVAPVAAMQPRGASKPSRRGLFGGNGRLRGQTPSNPIPVNDERLKQKIYMLLGHWTDPREKPHHYKIYRQG